MAVLVAYLIGAIPFGYLLVKLTTGKDVRASGSGNIGATNVLRTTGRAIAVVTLLLDIGKGVAAVWHAGSRDAWRRIVDERGGAGGDGGARVSRVSQIQRRQGRRQLHRRVFVSDAVADGRGAAGVRHRRGGDEIHLGRIRGVAAMFPLGVWMILHPPAPVLIASLIAGAFIVYGTKRISIGCEPETRTCSDGKSVRPRMNANERK